MAGRPPSLIFVIWNGPRNHAKEKFYGYRPLLKEIRRFAIFQYLSRLLPLTAMLTRSSATAEVPRDAPCQSKSCQLLHNSVGTTGTTSPEQIEVMELEGYSQPTCSKLCASNHDALDRRGLIHSRRVLLSTKSTCRGHMFQVHSLGAKFQRKVPLLLALAAFRRNTMYDRP